MPPQAPLPHTLLFDRPTITALQAYVWETVWQRPPEKAAPPKGPKLFVDPWDVPVAVVGMACTMPMAPSVAEFWTLLVQGRDAQQPLDTRFDMDELYSPKQVCMSGRRGGTAPHPTPPHPTPNHPTPHPVLRRWRLPMGPTGYSDHPLGGTPRPPQAGAPGSWKKMAPHRPRRMPRPPPGLNPRPPQAGVPG